MNTANSIEDLFNMGMALKQMLRLSEAEDCYRRLIAIKPDCGEAYANLGNILKQAARLNEAESCYRMALNIAPHLAVVHFNLGTLLQDAGRLDEAEISYQHALQIKPDFTEACSNLASTLKESGRLIEAEMYYRQALHINPDSSDLHCNLGAVLKDLGRFQEAEASCLQALEINPDFAGAHNNLGIIHKESGRLLNAEACYRRALQIQPDYAEAHSNLAITLLTRGELMAGWEEMEWRWKTPQMTSGWRHFAQPQWRGEEARGKTLLIHAEQGLGDTLQFCRYASLVAESGLKVILEVQAPLIKLLRGLNGVDQVVARDETLPPFDLHCPMLSLPLALRITQIIPTTASYLLADKSQVKAWQIRLATLPDKGHRVGLVWAGNSHAHWPQAALIDRQRSISPEQLAPVLALPGFTYFSLQKEGKVAPEDLPLIDFMNEMKDLSDTAALIANLDLVITVDTAVAHLTAALGKPVWILIRSDSCWRWFREREDCPWYPSARLFRQPKPGEWQTVIEKVTEQLSLFSHHAPPSISRSNEDKSTGLTMQ